MAVRFPSFPKDRAQKLLIYLSLPHRTLISSNLIEANIAEVTGGERLFSLQCALGIAVF